MFAPFCTSAGLFAAKTLAASWQELQVYVNIVTNPYGPFLGSQ